MVYTWGMSTHTEPDPATRRLAEVVRGARTLVVTGAGVSTDAGIPDYRGVGTTPVAPVDYEQFVTDPVWYRWVWARNHATWRLLEPLTPTPAHRALARLEDVDLVTGVSTQNVARLHSRAGQRTVYELHGAYDRVVCLSCGALTPRAALDRRLSLLNPDYPRETDPAQVAITPEADRAAAEGCGFRAVNCETCGGLLKPDIVFFGEGLPEALEQSLEAARHCDVVLVVGTSLVVSTGMWVVRQAVGRGAALAVINRGPTMVDDVADLRIEGGASQVLGDLSQHLAH